MYLLSNVIYVNVFSFRIVELLIDCFLFLYFVYYSIGKF